MEEEELALMPENVIIKDKNLLNEFKRQRMPSFQQWFGRGVFASNWG